MIEPSLLRLEFTLRKRRLEFTICPHRSEMHGVFFLPSRGVIASALSDNFERADPKEQGERILPNGVRCSGGAAATAKASPLQNTTGFSTIASS
ncbi:hypothetical protein chiPu_0013621 [Chiloscyllium punctatum]|uniref:Uncharacterized protein n=1 Tax=Chiloscyllium punctatum TaxID=137246 RepID=A0A401SXP0_CHIPU|nr:hypothetical protein [Chiloscyllium punctatum]